jgi:hypothetical protein
MLSDVTSTACHDRALNGPEATDGGVSSGALTKLIMRSFQRP